MTALRIFTAWLSGAATVVLMIDMQTHTGQPVMEGLFCGLLLAFSIWGGSLVRHPRDYRQEANSRERRAK